MLGKVLSIIRDAPWDFLGLSRAASVFGGPESLIKAVAGAAFKEGLLVGIASTCGVVAVAVAAIVYRSTIKKFLNMVKDMLTKKSHQTT